MVDPDWCCTVYKSRLVGCSKSGLHWGHAGAHAGAMCAQLRTALYWLASGGRPAPQLCRSRQGAPPALALQGCRQSWRICLSTRWLHSISCHLRCAMLLQVEDDFVDSLEGRQPVELQAELDGKLAALRRRAGALAAEDCPTRQVWQAAALYHQACPPSRSLFDGY